MSTEKKEPMSLAEMEQKLKANRKKELEITNRMWDDSLDCFDLNNDKLNRETIKLKTQELALKLKNTYSADEILILFVMDGVLPFASLLLKAFRTLNYNCPYASMQTTSYSGLQSGEVKIGSKPKQSVAGRTIIVVDEVCDTGKTYKAVSDYLLELGASKVELLVLVDKKQDREEGCEPTYVGSVVSKDSFLLGLGLDYQGYLRNTNEIRVANLETLPNDEEKAIFKETKLLSQEIEALKANQKQAPKPSLFNIKDYKKALDSDWMPHCEWGNDFIKTSY